jgi:hypothetical protein
MGWGRRRSNRARRWRSLRAIARTSTTDNVSGALLNYRLGSPRHFVDPGGHNLGVNLLRGSHRLANDGATNGIRLVRVKGVRVRALSSESEFLGLGENNFVINSELFS